MTRVRRWAGPIIAAVVIVEIAVFAQVWAWLGGGWTIGLALAGSVLGGWLMAREGAATWRRLRDSARRGQSPDQAAGDVPLVLLGGVLMLMPGFVTDLVGLLLVLAPTRSVARHLLGDRLVGARLVGARLGGARPGPGRGRVIPGEARVSDPGRTGPGDSGPTSAPVVWTQIDPRQDPPAGE